MGFSDNVYELVIDNFSFDVGDRFTYAYNINENWLHDIRVEGIEKSTLSNKALST